MGHRPSRPQPLHTHARTHTQSPVKGNCLNQGVPYMAVVKHSRVPTNRSLTSRVLGAVLEQIAYCLSHEVTSMAISGCASTKILWRSSAKAGVQRERRSRRCRRSGRCVGHSSRRSFHWPIRTDSTNALPVPSRFVHRDRKSSCTDSTSPHCPPIPERKEEDAGPS